MKTEFQEQFVEPSLWGIPLEAEKRCKIPCRKMTIGKVRASRQVPKKEGISLRFESHVQLEKKFVAYTGFNFIVDVGSSLGLWLGLSALGVFETAIHALTKVKRWSKLFQ